MEKSKIKTLGYNEYKQMIKEEVNNVFGHWKDFQLKAITDRDTRFCQRNVHYRLQDYDVPFFCWDQDTNVAIHELMESKGCNLYTPWRK